MQPYRASPAIRRALTSLAVPFGCVISMKNVKLTNLRVVETVSSLFYAIKPAHVSLRSVGVEDLFLAQQDEPD